MAVQDPVLPRVYLSEEEVSYSLSANDANTQVWGNPLHNHITGNSANNVLNGDGGVDTLIGGAGDDIYYVEQPNDFLGLVGDLIIEAAGEGIDTVYSDVGYALGANVENLILAFNDQIPITSIITGTGNALNNTIVGNEHPNVLYGLIGNDVLIGGLGDDYMDGGIGVDTMEGGVGNDIYVVTASDRVLEANGGGTDTVSTNISYTLVAFVEDLTAFGSGSISLFGNTLNNVIHGNSGRNTINGRSGDDTLWGGAGKDTLTGSTGRDKFGFDTKLNKTTNLDKIVDFNVKDDTIWLDNAIFTKLGQGTESSPRKLNKAYFKIGDKAQDRNDYILYNNKTGALSYDADGSGKSKAVEIAQLSKSLKMTYLDVFIV